MNQIEFMHYCHVYEQQESILQEYENVIQQAYENISPSMTTFNELGEIRSMSVSVEANALFIIELKEQQEIQKRYLNAKVDAMEKAFRMLSEEERASIKRVSFYGIPYSVKISLMEALSKIIDETPILKRKTILEPFMSIQEWDEAVENMSDEELFEDYWDKSELYDLHLKIKEKNK